MSPEEREGMIETLSVMTFKDKRYFEKMNDRELCEAYDRMMKII